ncbi:MAG: FeoA family protein [Methanomicrobium sp.]|nr:FeoA family protein [Methanomicrobium sp.]
MNITLSHMEYGAEGVITEIKKYSRELNSLGIRVGKIVKMITKQPIKGPVVVMTGEVQVAVGIEMASCIIVNTGILLSNNPD